jgi:hypothetical protein
MSRPRYLSPTHCYEIMAMEHQTSLKSFINHFPRHMKNLGVTIYKFGRSSRVKEDELYRKMEQARVIA